MCKLLVYGLKPIKNGTPKEKILFNISLLKKNIKYTEIYLRKMEKEKLKYLRKIENNIKRLEIENLNLKKCINNKFVK